MLSKEEKTPEKEDNQDKDSHFEDYPEEYEWRGGDYFWAWLGGGLFCLLLLLGVGGCVAMAFPK